MTASVSGKNRRFEQFSLDALVELAMRLGLTVRMSMTRPYRRAAIEGGALGLPSLLRADASYSVEV